VRRLQPQGDGGAGQGDDHERHQQPGAHRDALLAGDDQREQHDRSELADRAGAEDAAAERRVELAGLAQDRQQGADGGGAEHHRHQHRICHQPGGPQAEGQRQRQPDRQPPAGDAELQRPAAQLGEVELHAGEKEQERQAERRQRPQRAVGVHQVEDLRADDDAEGQLENHQRQAQADRQLVEERRQRGDEQHQQQGVMVDRHQSLGIAPVP